MTSSRTPGEGPWSLAASWPEPVSGGGDDVGPEEPVAGIGDDDVDPAEIGECAVHDLTQRAPPPGGADRVRRPGSAGRGPPGHGHRVVHQPQWIRYGDGCRPVGGSALPDHLLQRRRLRPAGDGLVIEGGGADLWGGTNEFGTIHRVAAFGLSSVATPTPGGVADTQDIGVFMTAANDWTGTRGIAGFQDFSVT
ncbi:hypothetical protein SVIO_004860 [Streptomyces violaceusniger]|uniref:Uncharacterized protein n=1 Tax=Streptomyces violaceusniger TaxID=68280 RepID=A0A4D4KVL8_STRVO|nr:hypothetical protein SVIO_004860 [Streptomyces violaceusniger]